MPPMFPLRMPIEVSNPPQMKEDRFGNKRTIPPTYRTIHVAGWAVTTPEETHGEHIQLNHLTLQVICAPEDAPDPAGYIRTPDGRTWAVDGPPIDHRHGPWWNPGLVIVTATLEQKDNQRA